MGGHVLDPIKKPNFFILGAAKSGTTSLYAYLRQHPDVFMPSVKEPTFFCEGFQVVKNPVRYFELFDPVNGEQAIGEASHAYMTDPSSARILKGLFPDARFIVILRHPADRAYSLYHHMRRYGYEKIGTFEEALKVEDRRASSPIFREKCKQYFYNYLYFRSGLYSEQIERFLSFFEKKSFYFTTLNSLKTNPLREVKLIFEFLDLKTDFVPDIKIHNEGSMTTRAPFVQYFWNTKVLYPRFLRKMGLKVLRKVNFMKVPPLSKETRNALLPRYESDLRRLGQLTGITL